MDIKTSKHPLGVLYTVTEGKASFQCIRDEDWSDKDWKRYLATQLEVCKHLRSKE